MALFILRKLKVINTFYMITKLALSTARSILWNLRNQRNLRKAIIVFLHWQDNLRFILREKCPNTEFFSGPYFPVFGLNFEIYPVMRRAFSPNAEKCGPKKSPYFDTFHVGYSDIFSLICLWPHKWKKETQNSWKSSRFQLLHQWLVMVTVPSLITWYFSLYTTQTTFQN